jgi:pyridoxal biosynthesis lyase PdxS
MSALKSMLVPGARWNEGGYTQVAEAITDPDKKFNTLAGEVSTAGLHSAGQLVGLAGALKGSPEMALSGLAMRLGADGVGAASGLLEQSDNKRKAGKVLDTINRMQGRKKE